MQQLRERAQSFRHHVSADSDKYRRLAEGQAPQALFITCSDSRVVPAHITGAGPGDLFELRTAGSIVPPYDHSPACSEAATISYAVEVLGIRDIVVCGHSHCGALDALVSGTDLAGLPGLGRWLDLARPSLGLCRPGADSSSGTANDPALTRLARRHVAAQLTTLATYPSVRPGIERGEVRLHGWFYRIDTGEVDILNRSAGEG
nr:probable carbonic anhydrase b-CA(2) [Streptomyces sp.]